MGSETHLAAPAVVAGTARAEVDPRPDHAPWRAIHLIWGILAVGVLALVAAGVPDAYRGHAALCEAGANGCEPLDAEARADLDRSGVSPRVLAAYDGVAIPAVTMLTFAGVAAVIMWRRPRDRFAVFAATTLLLFGTVAAGSTIQDLARAHPAWDVPVRVLELLGQVSFAALFYLFPDGRWVPRWTRWLLGVVAALFAVNIFAPGHAVDLFSGPVFLLFIASLVGAQVHRYRNASGPVQRQQTKWVCFGSSSALAGFAILLAMGLASPALAESVVGLTVLRTGMYALLALVPVSIGVAILRHRLWDIDLVINRTLVWTTLTVAGLALYLAVVAVAGAAVPTASDSQALVAAAVVAVAFAPLRARIQVAANRLLYGHRDDPHAVVTHLGERLEASLAPDAVLSTVVDTVHEALRLPYVALEAHGTQSHPEPVASIGSPGPVLTRVPLTHAGEVVGALVVAPRPGERTLARPDLRVLQELAPHAGLALHALRLRDEAQRLAAALSRSRQQLVSAREEERRRLRRDLHDGLGPQLASLALKAEIVRDMVPPEHGGTALLDQIVDQAEGSVVEVRRLVDGLRPPALDDLSLVGAIRATARQIGGRGIAIEIEAPDELPHLPAATEVAAYRIVQESLHNVVRHAGATRAHVELRVDGDVLEVSVRDDGCGLPTGPTDGVGLGSMAERASEVGGTFEVVHGVRGGHVRARVPLVLDDPAESTVVGR